MKRAAVLVVLTILSIAIHESGHYVVYRTAGQPVRVTLQSVRAVGRVDPGLDFRGKLAGPLLSIVVGAVCVIVARQRHGFAWPTAALTNSSIRIFPCAMDLARAVRGAKPFSDEGDIAIAITHDPAGRAAIVFIALAISLALTIFAARQYDFARHRGWKALGIYIATLAIGIAVVIVDELR